MKKLKIKQKVILSNLFILLSLLFVLFFIIYPTLKYINNLKDNIEFTESEIEESYQRITSLRKSINQLNEIKTKVEPFYFLTVDKGDELIVIKELENLAFRNNVMQSLGVSFIEKNFINKDSLANDSHYIFKINISGTFLEVLNYLDDLGELPYYFLIENINIGKEKNQENKTITANFSVILNSTISAYSKIE